MKFAWDPRKARANLRLHGVSFDEAVTIFADGLARTIPDPDHSWGEERFAIEGVSSAQRLIVVCYTDSGDLIRIISARQATSHERKYYEDQTNS
jgi:uncharacterized DUF497 family protein